MDGNDYNQRVQSVSAKYLRVREIFEHHKREIGRETARNEGREMELIW